MVIAILTYVQSVVNTFQTTVVLFLSGFYSVCLLKRTMSLLLLEHSSQMYLQLVISLFEAQEMSGCQKKRLNIYIAVQKGHGIVHRDKDNPSVINCLI